MMCNRLLDNRSLSTEPNATVIVASIHESLVAQNGRWLINTISKSLARRLDVVVVGVSPCTLMLCRAPHTAAT